MSKDPSAMDWGPVVADQYDSNAKIVMHVVNHRLAESTLKINVLFLRGRAKYFRHHIPPGTQQWVIFDDRGQEMSHSLRESLRTSLADCFARTIFWGEQG